MIISWLIPLKLSRAKHSAQSVCIRSYSGPYFSRIRTEYGEIEYLSVFSPNAGKCGEMRTRITPNTDSFYAVKEATQ